MTTELTGAYQIVRSLFICQSLSKSQTVRLRNRKGRMLSLGFGIALQSDRVNELRFPSSCSASGESVPYAVMHLLGPRDSFFHGAEGATQTPIAVVHHAVEIELVLDEVNVPDPPPLSVEDNQNSLRVC